MVNQVSTKQSTNSSSCASGHTEAPRTLKPSLICKHSRQTPGGDMESGKMRVRGARPLQLLREGSAMLLSRLPLVVHSAKPAPPEGQGGNAYC